MNKKAGREIMMYLIAGILTTIVNFAVYYAMIFMHVDNRLSNTAAFLVSVFTYLLDIGTMVVLVEILGVGRYGAKVWANGVVMISNYVISKFWIFRQ